MKVGDLVRLRVCGYEDKTSLVTDVRVYKFVGSDNAEQTWVELHNEPQRFRAIRLEVISESR